MRGELTSILARAAEALPNVTYRYGCGVSEIRQSELSATALLSDSGRTEEFTAIVGADGAMSKVRRLASPSEAQQDCIKPVNTYIAYFSIPGDPAYDVPNSHLQHGDKGRAIWMRPIDEAGTHTSCLFMITAESPELQHAAESADQEQQKAVLDNMFKDLDGIGPRAIRGMHGCADFHFARIVQVKLDTWHHGRVGLVGDAAYCPSPLTGQGTTLALLGAYTLAGEMLRHPEDPRGAFTAYERQIGDFVRKCQQIPLRGKAPKLALPQTAWGIWTLRTFFRLIMSTRLWKLLKFGEDPMKIKLPQYEWR